MLGARGRKIDWMQDVAGPYSRTGSSLFAPFGFPIQQKGQSSISSNHYWLEVLMFMTWDEKLPGRERRHPILGIGFPEQ